MSCFDITLIRFFPSWRYTHCPPRTSCKCSTNPASLIGRATRYCCLRHKSDRPQHQNLPSTASRQAINWKASWSPPRNQFAQGTSCQHRRLPNSLRKINIEPPTQMLPQRIVRSSALRSSLVAARRAPVVQRRAYLPTHYADKRTLDEKYPEPHTLTEAEDPGMVSLPAWRTAAVTNVGTERRLHQPPSHQETAP